MKKPIYTDYHSKVLDTYSIRQAEQQIDDERSRYKEKMTEWWNTLSKDEKAIEQITLNLFLLLFIRLLSPFLGLPAVSAPCSPNLSVFISSPSFATTMWDFIGWFGVLFGLL